MSSDVYEKLADILENTGKYRVLRQYEQPEIYNTIEDESGLSLGIFLDVETTGLNADTDKIIELGMVKFHYCKQSGKLFKILTVFDEFEDPGFEISEEITKLTGITSDMVSGKTINDSDVLSFIEDAHIILAHNASFDRKMVEARFPFFADKHWACSLHQVDWKGEGIPNAKLEYLAYIYGFFFSGHRASVDCLASIHLLAQKLPKSKKQVLGTILENARKPSYRIFANGLPYDLREQVKNRGYKWESTSKIWHKLLEGEEALANEKDFLEEIGIQSPKVITLTAKNRFSVREMRL